MWPNEDSLVGLAEYHSPMNLYVTHESALAFWLSPRARRGKANGKREGLPSLAPTRSNIDLAWLEEWGFDVRPLHVDVGEKQQVRRRPDLVAHLAGGQVQAGSYEHIAADVWAASPELCFCQIAGTVSLIEAVKTGYELCAHYRIEPSDMRGFEGREPATTASRLQAFAQRYGGKGAKGAKAARVAAKYIRGAAASPMETAAAMLLTLPRYYGGFGLPACKMNYPVYVAGPDGRGGNARMLYGDMVWPDRRVIVEYDSDFFHQGSERIHADAARRNAFLGAGWKVFTLTKRQLYSVEECEVFVAQLARALRAYNAHATPQAMERRHELRQLVLG